MGWLKDFRKRGLQAQRAKVAATIKHYENPPPGYFLSVYGAQTLIESRILLEEIEDKLRRLEVS